MKTIFNLWASIDNELYVSDRITNDELVLFALLQRNRIIGTEIAVASINMIQEVMKINGNKQRWNNQFRNTLQSLIDKEFINGIANINYQEISAKSIKPDELFYCDIPMCTDNYFKVSLDELDSIFLKLQNTNINKFNIARYFIAIQRVVNNEYNFGYLSQSNAKICGDSRTLATYNSFLKDNEFILINNEYVTPEKKYATTFFGKIGNKKDFEYNLAHQIKTRGLVKINKEKNGRKVSDKQKENARTKQIEKLERELEKLKNNGA